MSRDTPETRRRVEEQQRNERDKLLIMHNDVFNTMLKMEEDYNSAQRIRLGYRQLVIAEEALGREITRFNELLFGIGVSRDR